MVFCQFTIVNMMNAMVAERLRSGLQIHLSRFDSGSWLGGFLWIQRYRSTLGVFVPASRNPLKTLENRNLTGQIKRTVKRTAKRTDKKCEFKEGKNMNLTRLKYERRDR